jgi:hypothetical protein
MNAESWISLVGLLATVVIVPLFRLLIRIDRRLYSISFNHLAHIYAELERISGRKPPSLDDLK